ncbi:MAG: 2-oxoacid:acceptor oxidoreductase family protein [Firmicutes bacterium]|nr:2-oxoacid:acceptor oxidoreductase family protein [Bacillota bacterium]
MLHEIVMAGFGGQGVMVMGLLMTYAGMLEGKNVSWIPSYGPEMRGGTSNCTVIVSDKEIASPVVGEPSAVVAMNAPSMEKFGSKVKPGGVLLYNSSLITEPLKRSDITQVGIPANELAAELGNSKIANVIALGALLELTRAVSLESARASLKKVLPAHRQELIPINEAALEKGAASVKR